MTLYLSVAGVIIVAILVFLAPATVTAAEIYTFQDEDGVRFFTNISGPGRTQVPLPSVGEGSRRTDRGEFSWRRDGVQPASVSAHQREGAYEPIITSAGRHYEIDPDVIRAVINAESGYDAQAVSPKGAMGLMQLMPETARQMGVGNAFDPVQNIHGGVRYLSELLGALSGDLPLALAAYNAGLSRVFGERRIPPISETRSYVERVLSLYRKLKGRNTL
jgi:soluble lytic murein transglycosylase-like protein